MTSALDCAVATTAPLRRISAEIDASGIARMLSLTNPVARIAYIDTAKDLGHYTEYLYFADPAKSGLLCCKVELLS